MFKLPKQRSVYTLENSGCKRAYQALVPQDESRDCFCLLQPRSSGWKHFRLGELGGKHWQQLSSEAVPQTAL